MRQTEKEELEKELEKERAAKTSLEEELQRVLSSKELLEQAPKSVDDAQLLSLQRQIEELTESISQAKEQHGSPLLQPRFLSMDSQQETLEVLRKENQCLNERILQLITERESALKTNGSLESTILFLRSDLESRDKQITFLTQLLQEKNQTIGQLRSAMHSYSV